MGGDYSRQRFSPKNDFASVLMQQGRVQLDSDWNELADIFDRRWRAETIDIIGRAVVPAETPEAFQIKTQGAGANRKIFIGRGRMYVDGLLAENRGTGDPAFDLALSELRGSTDLPFESQPYFPNPGAIPATGTHFFYLDVWQREVTHLEAPFLVEEAVGVDTTTRRQTVWQVKALTNVDANLTCSTDPAQIRGANENGQSVAWSEVIAPSGGRLSTKPFADTADPDPCQIPQTPGFRGQENQLYRVEIHDGGAQDKATFKWSRYNASIATSVSAVNGTELTVGQAAKDSVLRFRKNAWVEITDDLKEFAGKPGELREIQDVDESGSKITLKSALPADLIPSGAGTDTHQKRHTRIRQWDQSGEVRRPDGAAFFTVVSTGTSPGRIPLPPPGDFIVLENGVQVAFDLDTRGGGVFRPGDYWMFAARVAGASIEQLEKTPPHGVHHHYARLAVLSTSPEAQSCRTLWPPKAETGKDAHCECTVCIPAGADPDEIQKAIETVKANGGTVCIAAGRFELKKPIIIEKARSLRIKGQGWRTQLSYKGKPFAIAVEKSADVVLENLSIRMVGDAAVTGIQLRNVMNVSIENCLLRIQDKEQGGRAIGLNGYTFKTSIRNNVLVADIGIGGRGEEQKSNYLLTWGLYVEDNLMLCSLYGVELKGAVETASIVIHRGQTRVSGNTFYYCRKAAILLTGCALPGSPVNIDENAINARGGGIVVGADDVRVTNNDIRGARADSSIANSGIVLTSGLNFGKMDRCQIFGNRVTSVGGHGIFIRTRVHSAMIKQNVIEDVGGGGIVGESDGVEDLKIENNQIWNVGKNETRKTATAGIAVGNTQYAEIASNTIHSVGSEAVAAGRHAGIQVRASRVVRIAGNRIADIGPAKSGAASIRVSGIEIVAPFDRADIVDNIVKDSAKMGGEENVCALLVRKASEKKLDGSRASLRGRALIQESSKEGEAVMLESGPATFLLQGDNAVVFTKGDEVLSIRNNSMESRGGDSTVKVSARMVTFNDNQCRFATREREAAVLIAEADVMVASGNTLLGMGGVGMLIKAGADHVTLLGNITRGGIWLLDDQNMRHPLGNPWKNLNVNEGQ